MAEISTVAAYQRRESRRSLLTARLKPDAGKPAGRNFRVGGGNEGTVWRPFAMKLERADTLESAGRNCSRLHSTRPKSILLVAAGRAAPLGWSAVQSKRASFCNTSALHCTHHLQASSNPWPVKSGTATASTKAFPRKMITPEKR